MSSQSVRITFLVPLLFLGSAQISRARVCSNHDFSGIYGTLAEGNLVTPPIPSLAGPFARMGRGEADGRGNFFAQTVDSFNGLITRADFGGTYVVGSDCSLTLNLLVPIPGIPGLIPFTFVGALADNGREATVMVASPPGAVVRVQLRQQRRGRCSNRDLNKGFRLSAGGSIVSQLPSPSGFFNRVGIMEFDGDGKFSANTSVSYNGVTGTESFSGTYAIDAACFVTIRYTRGQPYVWSGFLTDNGDAVNLLATSPQGAVITGTLKDQ